MEKVVFHLFSCYFKYLHASYVFYCPESKSRGEERREEAETSKGDKRKGLSNSDLTMKCCGRK